VTKIKTEVGSCTVVGEALVLTTNADVTHRVHVAHNWGLAITVTHPLRIERQNTSANVTVGDASVDARKAAR